MVVPAREARGITNCVGSNLINVRPSVRPCVRASVRASAHSTRVVICDFLAVFGFLGCQFSSRFAIFETNFTLVLGIFMSRADEAAKFSKKMQI